MLCIMKYSKRLAYWLTCWIIVAPWRRTLRQHLFEWFVKTFVEKKAEVEIEQPITDERLFPLIQDCLIKTENLSAKKLIVMLVPEGNFMSGGIYSFFTIAKELKSLKHIHGCDVVVMTRPNVNLRTYVRQTHFRNEFIVYRFSQLCLFSELEELILFIPEESVARFHNIISFSKQIMNYIQSIGKLHINIMNQNILLMPERQEFQSLYQLTSNITQTTAHDQYCTQEFSDRYGLKTLLIPPFTDLSLYPIIPFEKKKKRILYSPDTDVKKSEILNTLAEELPEYELMEIKGMTFDYYVSLVSQSRFMITFGEGLDGYFAQTFLMQGVAFAVYNKHFFPESEDFNTENIFTSYDEMKEKIVESILMYERDESLRESAIGHYVDMQNRLYSKKRYLAALERFCLNEYDFYPKNH